MLIPVLGGLTACFVLVALGSLIGLIGLIAREAPWLLLLAGGAAVFWLAAAA